MKKAAAATSASVIDLRFGQVGLLQVRLREVDAPAIKAELAARIASAPQFFQHTGVCLDLSALEHPPEVATLRGIVEAIRLAGMITVGVSDASPTADQLAPALDLPNLPDKTKSMLPSQASTRQALVSCHQQKHK